jgi:hypothetical protein
MKAKSVVLQTVMRYRLRTRALEHRLIALESGRSKAAWRTTQTFANVETVQSTAIAPDLVFPGQTAALRHGHGRTIGT